MEYIIDGFNVIKTSFINKYGEKGKDFLIEIILKYKKKHPKVDFTIVFDGYPLKSSIYLEKRINIVFSLDITADEKIRKIIERKKREVIVVSDDREVIECAKILGKKNLSVKGFLDIIYPEKPQITLEKEINFKRKKKIEEELRQYYGKKIGKNKGKNITLP